MEDRCISCEVCLVCGGTGQVVAFLEIGTTAVRYETCYNCLGKGKIDKDSHESSTCDR